MEQRLDRSTSLLIGTCEGAVCIEHASMVAESIAERIPLHNLDILTWLKSDPIINADRDTADISKTAGCNRIRNQNTKMDTSLDQRIFATG